jgi:hypothetical protein
MEKGVEKYNEAILRIALKASRAAPSEIDTNIITATIRSIASDING